ncbi:MAG: hypothetical protein R8P61_22300 [Bacteroidia bacterium]|nr:hypothetical protein [Bacteroidia bacterium]
MKKLILFPILLSFSLCFSQQKSESGIKHSFVISGPKTMEIDEEGKVVWEYRDNSRDISKLANGNYLITYASKVVEVTPDKKEIWSYVSVTNPELMSAQRLPNGRTLITEQGEQPRLVEADERGFLKDFLPIYPESYNIHMQTRMSRKLPNGRYLVPHRISPFVKEYNKNGKTLRTFRVDIPELGGKNAKNGTFAAIRMKDGSTLVTLASGNRMVRFDKRGKVAWQLTNEEMDGQLNDVCGLQVLKNGNYLVSCYGNQAEDGLKMMEITPDKEVIWTYQNPDVKYVHNFQVLSTNGVRE